MRYQLSFPSTLDLDAVTAFVRALTIRPNDRLFSPTRPLAFTLRAEAASVVWSIEVDPRQERLVLGQLRTHLPNVRAEAFEVDLECGATRLGTELKLSHHARPLRTDVVGEIAAGLLGVFQGLRTGESVTIQWLLGPPLPRRIAKPEPSTREQTVIERMVYPPRLDAEEARARNQKQKEPVFGALGRIAVSAATRSRRRSLITSTLGILRLTSSPSAHLLPRLITSGSALRRLDRRVTPLISWPCTLNAEEFAALLGWPVGGPIAAGVVYSGRRELPFPQELVVSERVSERDDSARFRVLGQATHPSRPGLVIQRPSDALQHTHIIGPTGVGKSTLLTHLAEADIRAGRGVVVIEPRGDVITDLLDRIPEHRLEDVVLLDPSDIDRPVGLRLFDARASETAVDSLVHLLREQFSGSWGPRTQDILMASLTTLARTPDMTLVELPALLSDVHFRREVTASFRGDIAVGAFWQWFESLSDAERTQVIAPVLNKVRAFTMRSSLRRILGQSDPQLHMRDVFTKRRIVLVALKAGEIGPELAGLLGGLVVSQLWQAAQERTQISPERRHPVMVYLDEFQTYLRLPTDLAEVLAQARGLGLGLTLAHQHLGQLGDPSIRSAVMQNARSKIVFQSGTEDAGTLAKSLGAGLTPDDIAALGRYEAYARLMHAGGSTAPGSLVTLPPSSGLGSAPRARAASWQKFGRGAAQIDDEIRARQSSGGDGARGGRRRRAS